MYILTAEEELLSSPRNSNAVDTKRLSKLAII